MRSGPMPNALARTKPSGVRIPPESQPPEETARNVPFQQESHRSKARPRRSDWMREENFNEEIWDYAGMFSYSLGGDGHCGVRETLPRGKRKVLLCCDQHKFDVLARGPGWFSGRGQGAQRKG